MSSKFKLYNICNRYLIPDLSEICIEYIPTTVYTVTYDTEDNDIVNFLNLSDSINYIINECFKSYLKADINFSKLDSEEYISKITNTFISKIMQTSSIYYINSFIESFTSDMSEYIIICNNVNVIKSNPEIYYIDSVYREWSISLYKNNQLYLKSFRIPILQIVEKILKDLNTKIKEYTIAKNIKKLN